MARGMADAATVPMIEFTICDTFVAPVGAVFNALPKLQLDTEERREGYLARMHGLPGLLETAAQRHRDGAAAGRTAVARLVDSAITQLDMLLEDPSLGGIARPDQDDVPFAESLAEVVADDVRPALSAYREALRNDILPTARDDQHPGICFLPDGEQMYGILARLHTSMTFSPDELHAMGRRIVEEVHEELKETAQRLWNTTDITDIFERLSNDPSLRYESREEMLEHARRVVAAAEAEAPSWFAVVPDQPCVVEPVPEAEEAGMAAAYYMPGAIDGSRSGTYYLNTSKPAERHRYASEDIAFHEAVPGHHFQLTIAMESADLVPARRVLYDTACAEGWGLYSERLADEMGLYSDDLSRMGLFVADAWRASRLVVDTGLHAMGWTRDQALEWMTEHTPLPRIEVESEVDRYISYPGQALAYMVGRREIVRLRSEAADRLGRASTSARSTTSSCAPASCRCRRWPASSSAGRPASLRRPALHRRFAPQGRGLVPDRLVHGVHPPPRRPAAHLGTSRHLELERHEDTRLDLGQGEVGVEQVEHLVGQIGPCRAPAVRGRPTTAQVDHRSCNEVLGPVRQQVRPCPDRDDDPVVLPVLRKGSLEKCGALDCDCPATGFLIP